MRKQYRRFRRFLLVDADFRERAGENRNTARPRAHTRTPSTPNADTHVTMNALCASPVVAPQFAGAKKSFAAKKVRARAARFRGVDAASRHERRVDFARSRRKNRASRVPAASRPRRLTDAPAPVPSRSRSAGRRRQARRARQGGLVPRLPGERGARARETPASPSSTPSRGGNHRLFFFSPRRRSRNNPNSARRPPRIAPRAPLPRPPERRADARALSSRRSPSSTDRLHQHRGVPLRRPLRPRAHREQELRWRGLVHDGRGGASARAVARPRLASRSWTSPRGGPSRTSSPRARSSASRRRVSSERWVRRLPSGEERRRTDGGWSRRRRSPTGGARVGADEGRKDDDRAVGAAAVGWKHE